MELVDLEKITVMPDRQRRFFDEMKLVDLAEDIADNDLLHAVVLRKGEDTLVAGGRRLRAITMLFKQGKPFSYNGEPVPLGKIPVTRVSPRDEDKYFEAELNENLLRDDLTWQEQAEARARLHELRKLKNPKQTVRDTVRDLEEQNILSISDTTIGEDIILADALDDTDVQKATSRKEALKIIEMKRRREHNELLAQEFKALEVQDSCHYLRQGSAIPELRKLHAGTVDVVLTDPPYGIGADTFGDQTLIDHQYDDSLETWENLVSELAVETFRVTKSEAHAYVFCDPRRFAYLADRFREAGWYVWPTPLIWDKGNVGTLPRPEHGPRRCYEMILYAIKGDMKTTGVHHDVIRIAGTAKPRHAAEKPVALYVDLLRRSTRPGMLAIDPFAGSGTIFPAANQTSLRAIGIEADGANIGIASERLNSEE